MSLVKALVVSSLCIVIVACSSSPYLDDYLGAIDVPDAYVYFEHSEHGLMDNQQAPLVAEFTRCNKACIWYAGNIAGWAVVSDIQVLERINQDYHAFLLEVVMLDGGEDKQVFKKLYHKTGVSNRDVELRYHAFGYTSGLKRPLKALTYLVLGRNKCLAREGWLYKRAGF